MGRPRKTAVDALVDGFADMTVDQQDGILITLAAIHRQAKRIAQRLPPCPRCGGPGGTNPGGLCGDCHEDVKREDVERNNETGAMRTPVRE